MFKNKNTVKRHIQSIHEGMKFQCDLCGNEFSQQSGVALHKKNVHKIGTKSKDSQKISDQQQDYHN